MLYNLADKNKMNSKDMLLFTNKTIKKAYEIAESNQNEKIKKEFLEVSQKNRNANHG